MNEDKPKRMALIASQGTLDWAYPPFILASTAAAMEMHVAVYFGIDCCGNGDACGRLFHILRVDVVEKEDQCQGGASQQSCNADEDALWSEGISKY